MIVVQVELWPLGHKPKARTLCVLKITNDGTGTATLGNYTYEMSHAGKFYGKRMEPYKKGAIKNFPRKWSPYRLIARVLKDAREG